MKPRRLPKGGKGLRGGPAAAAVGLANRSTSLSGLTQATASNQQQRVRGKLATNQSRQPRFRSARKLNFSGPKVSQIGSNHGHSSSNNNIPTKSFAPNDEFNNSSTSKTSGDSNTISTKKGTGDCFSGKQAANYTCSGCNKLIKDKYLLNACDKFWHNSCLKCDRCQAKLGELGSTLYEKANMNLCRQDYLEMFGQKAICSVCDKLIYASEMVMRARENVYHLECFACQLCGLRFCVGDRFHLCENKIVCQYDYDEHILPIQESMQQLDQQQNQLQHQHQHQHQQHDSNSFDISSVTLHGPFEDDHYRQEAPAPMTDTLHSHFSPPQAQVNVNTDAEMSHPVGHNSNDHGGGDQLNCDRSPEKEEKHIINMDLASSGCAETENLATPNTEEESRVETNLGGDSIKAN